MIELTGDSAEHDLGNGVRLTAPGVTGVAELPATTLPLVTPSGQLFDHALGNSGLARRPPVLITHSTPAAGVVTVKFPAPAPNCHSLLLVHDSTGAASWHRPKDPTAAELTFKGQTPAAAAAAAPAELTFELPAERFAAGHPHASWMARFAGLLHHFSFHKGVDGAKKVLSVLDYPITHLGAWGATTWIDHWDRSKHPSVIRWFPPTGGQATGEPLSPTNWATLDRANGPVLLFVHGIFSTCNGAFGAIGEDPAVWASLRTAYGNGRIIGYDHPTVSVGPEDNAIDFLAQIPDGVTLDVDIVCHSRGGLVARALAGQSSAVPNAGAKLNVRRIVFAATPNGGSQIAVPNNWGALIDRVSSVLTLPSTVLPVPIDEITSILAGVLEIIKAVAVDTTVNLPGLEDMKPGSDLLARLGAFSGTAPEYFAAASEFEPGPVLANLFNSIDDLGHVVDEAIFPKIYNDIAVPTNGVWDPANPNGATPPPPTAAIPGFPVPVDRRLPIGPTSVYWHSAYFDDPAMRAALVEWLTL